MNIKSYLIFLDRLSKINKQFKLSGREIILLDLVGKAYYQKQVVTVKNLICNQFIASQETLRSTLHKLIRNKLLWTKNNPEDGRIKFVTLTHQSLHRYEMLNAALIEAVCHKN